MLLKKNRDFFELLGRSSERVEIILNISKFPPVQDDFILPICNMKLSIFSIGGR